MVIDVIFLVCIPLGFIPRSLGKCCMVKPQSVSTGVGQALNESQEQKSSEFGDKQRGHDSVSCGVSLTPRLSDERAGDAQQGQSHWTVLLRTTVASLGIKKKTDLHPWVAVRRSR